jgi:hypothetical protein
MPNIDFETRTKPIADALVECEGVVENSYWVNYQPGNGTAYRFLFQRLLRGSSPAKWLFGEHFGGFLVTFMPSFSYHTFAFSDGSYLAPHYVKEKVGCGIADAIVLAEVFAHLAELVTPGSGVVATDAKNDDL